MTPWLAYDTGNGIHPKVNGRAINAVAWNAALIAADLL
jgi:hypothetical protein